MICRSLHRTVKSNLKTSTQVNVRANKIVKAGIYTPIAITNCPAQSAPLI
jgi:hypothetical protein